MKRQFGLEALLIGGILVLTGCGLTNGIAEPETKTEVKTEAAENRKTVEIQDIDKDKSRTEIQRVENSKYQSIVWIGEAGKKEHGTGFLIGNNKILTNKHVVYSLEESKMVARVKSDSGETFDYKVKKVTPSPIEEIDLAIIELSPTKDGRTIDDKVKHFELASLEDIKKVKVGDAVNTIGYPGDKKDGTLWDSKGKILMFLGENYLAYDAFITHGNSGSPLFNEDGKVIGLSNASNDGADGEIMGFGFLLTDEIYTFIENNR